MGGDFSDFYHCFVITEQGDKHLLTHTYIGEIHERVTVPFSFTKFLELLETGKQELWREIFGVDEQECVSKYWSMIITEIT